ncbi:MAG: T9SS type A sorting domain-containing protein [Candidatus Eisenbacteria bacterium]|nr:T9SS type A sorting domain-containing protein [Candidatus Eisenbacteria bacterium]
MAEAVRRTCRVSFRSLDLQTLLMQTCTSCGGSSDQKYRLVPTIRNSGDGTADSVEVKMWEPTASGLSLCKTAFSGTLRAGKHRAMAEGFEFCNPAKTMTIDSLTVRRTVNGDVERLLTHAGLNPWGHTKEVSNITIDPLLSGLKVSWSPPSSLTDVLGYRLYVDSTGTDVWVPTDLTTDATTQFLRNRVTGTTYKIGVAVVDQNFTKGPIRESVTQKTNLAERSGWPKRLPKGWGTSVALVDLDGSGGEEIVIGGTVLSAFKGDGTSATSNSDGLLYDPSPSVPSNSTSPTFRGEIAAADIDADGNIEIVGTHGDGKIYVVRENGTKVWDATCSGLAGATLADIDKTGDSKMEVIVNSYPTGSLYVFKHDGSAFRNSNTVFHDLSSDSAAKYNFAGAAVGNLDSDNSLELIHPSRNGTVYALNTDATSYWTRTLISGGTNFSTPVVAKFSGGTQYDVGINATGSWWRSTVLKGTDGTDRAWWDASAFPDLRFESAPVQMPAVAELNGASGDVPEMVVLNSNDPTSGSGDPTNRASVLYKVGSTHYRAAALDSIPLPGRREEAFARTVGSAVIADLEADGVKEVLAVSNQGAVFAWEVIWSTLTSTFTVKAKKGWPLVFDEQPGNVAIGNIDSDSYMELVVATDDGYIHTYDLPGAASGNILWGAAGHDARRTGNYDAGASGPVQQANPLGDLQPGGGKVLGTGRNPTTLGTTISYQVPGTTRVVVDIVDVSGRRVRRVQDQSVDGGAHVVGWDGRDDSGSRVAAGVYFARIQMGALDATRKIVVGR